MSVSIAPSLFDLGQALDERNSKPLFKSPLIAGNPYLPESTNWSVPPLPGAAQEAEAVGKMMNAIPLLGRKATKAEIVSRAGESSLLYFATHGVASGRNPLSDSFLMLSADRFEQGWWTAREIQSTKLRAKIAVLSACQTGLGQAHDAGIIGLSRAFQIAGVPRVVMSLWSVDDQATSQLMQAFVKHLKTQFPSEALPQAMLEVRQEYSEPSKWASFVIFGTPR
jgi:CHAT domain-containing protein